MDGLTLFLGLALLIGLFMAWNIGANDVANAMGTSVGSGALTLKQAIWVAAVFEFGGAVLVGAHVAETIKGGIIPPEAFAASPEVFMYGMAAALLGASVWLLVATVLGLPVSTTHSIVGAVVGFGLLTVGWREVDWPLMGSIVLSWIVSPVCGGLIAFLMFTFVRREIILSDEPYDATVKWAPHLVALVGFTLALSILYKGLKNLHLDFSFVTALPLCLLVGGVLGLAMRMWLSRRPRPTGYSVVEVERLFAGLQVVTACYVAFAHGANDVANAIGPLAAVVQAAQEGVVAARAPVPIWILVLGGAGIVMGLATYGYRVIETVGHKITTMTPTRGFSAEFGAATTVLFASRLGLPISTTHTLVGSVIGVGLARGIAALDLRVIRNIVSSWIVTIPAAAVVTVLAYWGIAAVFA
ncbi:MAG: inorganic phosphate transporter [Gemmatimonadota bacterium]|nr:inorganic phosphate transporter [Gemmatimonadota bacterium]